MMPGTGGTPAAPPGYVPPGMPGVAPGTFSGIFRGRQVVVGGGQNGFGIFFYNGTPAAGNPPVFSAVSPGTTLDPFGNPVSAIVTIGTLAAASTRFDANGVAFFADSSGVTRVMVDPTNRVIEFFDAAGTGVNSPIISIASAAGADRFTAIPFPGGIALSGLPMLVYSGAPVTGNLLAALAPAAGNDGLSGGGNNFPQGLLSQQLTLANQGSAPPAFAGGSVLYSSGGGRLRYLASTGADVPVDRSSVNVAQFAMNTQTLPTIIGAPINYQANEGSQSSEYEIEIDGIATAPTSAAGTDPTLTMGLGVDGSVLGASFTVGSVFFPHGVGVTVNFTARFRLAILTTGVGGTCILAAEGSFNRAGTNAGNATNFNSTVGSNSGGSTKSFDSTSSHVIQPYANWSAVTSTGHGAVTYITRQQRRD